MRAEGEELFAGRTPHQGIRGNHTSGVVMRNVQTWRFDVYLTPALSVKLATVSRSADPNLAAIKMNRRRLIHQGLSYHIEARIGH